MKGTSVTRDNWNSPHKDICHFLTLSLSPSVIFSQPLYIFAWKLIHSLCRRWSLCSNLFVCPSFRPHFSKSHETKPILIEKNARYWQREHYWWHLSCIYFWIKTRTFHNHHCKYNAKNIFPEKLHSRKNIHLPIYYIVLALFLLGWLWMES